MRGVAQCGVCCRGGYRTIYTRGRGSVMAILGASLASTALACPHATARARGGREAPIGGLPPLGVYRPLTMSPRHRLHVMGYGLDMDHFSVVPCLVWVKLMASPLFLCANQRQKAPFSEFLHVFVLVTCKIISSKYMWNLANQHRIWLLKTANKLPHTYPFAHPWAKLEIKVIMSKTF